MKHLIVSALMLVVTSVTLAADQPGVPLGPPGPQIEKLATELQLDEYQKGEVKRILEERHQKMLQFREQAKASGQRPSREEMIAHRTQMEEDMNQQLQSVLTAEQLQKFKQLMAERRKDRRFGGPPAEQDSKSE